MNDEDWAFAAPYLALCREDALQRENGFRAVFKGMRNIMRTEAHWRMMPHDPPPWSVLDQQTRRLRAGCVEAMVHDLALILLELAGPKGQATAVILDSRTVQSTPKSKARAGCDGAKRRKGSKVHVAVNTLGKSLALKGTPADEQDRVRCAIWPGTCRA